MVALAVDNKVIQDQGKTKNVVGCCVHLGAGS